MAIQRAKYTGDPGLFGDIFGALKGAVGGAFRGFTGIPARPTAGPGGSPTGAPGYTNPGCPPGYTGFFRNIKDCTSPPGMGGNAPPGGIRFNPPFGGPKGIRFGPFSAFEGPMNGAAAPMNGKAGGYHLNKSSYFLMSGEHVPQGSKWVKNRKRNPANARATSRAISRIGGAKTYAKSLSRISIRKKC